MYVQQWHCTGGVPECSSAMYSTHEWPTSCPPIHLNPSPARATLQRTRSPLLPFSPLHSKASPDPAHQDPLDGNFHRCLSSRHVNLADKSQSKCMLCVLTHQCEYKEHAVPQEGESEDKGIQQQQRSDGGDQIASHPILARSSWQSSDFCSHCSETLVSDL